MTIRRLLLLPLVLLLATASTGGGAETSSPPSEAPPPQDMAKPALDVPRPAPIAEKAYHLVKNWDFGTDAGKTITGPEALWSEFQPNIHYDVPPGSHSITGGWERYRGLAKNYVFTPTSLQLIADIPPSGGLHDGGIDGAGIFSWGKFAFRYGYIEMRVRAPAFEKQGLWPAGQLVPADGSPADVVALDLFAIYNKNSAPEQHKNNVFLAVHGSGANTAPEYKAKTAFSWEGKSTGDIFGGGRFMLPAGSIYDDFHTYAAEWTEQEATFYVDDVPVMRRRFAWRRADGSEASPAYVLLDMSCGGAYGGWPTSLDEFPATLEVQYIRVWQKGSPG